MSKEEQLDLFLDSPLEDSEFIMTKIVYDNFGIDYNGPPRYLSTEEGKFYIDAFEEEADEYSKAKTLEDKLDALIDLKTFVNACLLRHGFPSKGPYAEVARANIKKELATSSEQSKRGWGLDLIKPKDWKAPDLKKYVRGTL